MVWTIQGSVKPYYIHSKGLSKNMECPWNIHILHNKKIDKMNKIAYRMRVLIRFRPSSSSLHRWWVARLATWNWWCIHAAPFTQWHRTNWCYTWIGWCAAGHHATRRSTLIRAIHTDICVRASTHTNVWHIRYAQCIIGIIDLCWIVVGWLLRLYRHTAAQTFLSLCHGRDWSKLFHHHIVAECSLNCYRGISSTTTTIFAFE